MTAACGDALSHGAGNSTGVGSSVNRAKHKAHSCVQSLDWQMLDQDKKQSDPCHAGFSTRLNQA
jgi:hypothetical protein